jgi:hypothetical protein
MKAYQESAKEGLQKWSRDWPLPIIDKGSVDEYTNTCLKQAAMQRPAWKVPPSVMATCVNAVIKSRAAEAYSQHAANTQAMTGPGTSNKDTGNKETGNTKSDDDEDGEIAEEEGNDGGGDEEGEEQDEEMGTNQSEEDGEIEEGEAVDEATKNKSEGSAADSGGKSALSESKAPNTRKSLPTRGKNVVGERNTKPAPRKRANTAAKHPEPTPATKNTRRTTAPAGRTRGGRGSGGNIA